MNDNSVLGKNWISKRYNEDQVNFLKENFDLSEIVSKLIAIRNINIEEVKLFLNPKIKNFLPNPFILKGIVDKKDSFQASSFVLHKSQKISKKITNIIKK